MLLSDSYSIHMRMAELSTRSGVATATIKYYQREGLLPDGERTASNQVTYNEAHVERLRLVRALIDVGGLSVAACTSVITALDSEVDLQWVFSAAQHAVSPELEVESISAEALEVIDAAMPTWHVSPDNPGRLAAARVYESFTSVGQSDETGWFSRYAEVALRAAELDIDELQTRPTRDAQAELVIVGTVLGDQLFSGFRRAAQEHVTSLRFGGGE